MTSPENGDVQHYSVGTKKTEASQTKKVYTRTLADVERDIKSLETKLEIVKNDPEEDQIAKEQGWYEMIETRLKALRAEREKHLNKNNKQ